MKITVERFNEEYAKHRADVLRYAKSILKDSAEAENVTQGVFLKLFKTDFKKELQGSTLPWLFTVTHNDALKTIRKRARVVLTDTIEVECLGNVPGPDVLLIAADEKIEETEDLKNAFKLLNAREKKIIKLRFEENKEYSYIAAEMHLSLGNVGFILHTIKKKLANAIKHHRIVRAVGV